MSWIMSIAAGLAIGYFVWQLVVNNKEGGAKTTGRLHKSTKDKKIAGVCGGIAEYFEIDSTIVRLAWVLFTLFVGAGLLGYIIALLVMPNPPVEQ